MKIVVDRYIPFIQGVLEPHGEVIYATPEQITPELVEDADALFIRTRTKVDGQLLAGSRCRFVATATIGMDHFDMEWCRANDINAVNAPGCNAPAVAQYVMASILRLTDRPVDTLTLAVVGVGHVGSIVERWARGLGMNVLLVDPPRAQKEPDGVWHSLDDAARLADIITFHTPLVRHGEHPTYHLGDRRFFESLEKRPIVINSSRGPVVDNRAWLEAVRADKISASAVDVWEGEPRIDTELMGAVRIATPHIAGYSMDGKIRATQMVLDAFSRHFGLPQLKADCRQACAVPDTVTYDDIRRSYNPLEDTALMRRALTEAPDLETRGKIFEHLRDSYNLRPEITLPNQHSLK